MCASALTGSHAFAGSGDRTLYLYYTHTKETAKITFRRNGRYDQKGLDQLNWFLRDWRRNEETKMDPKLFDLVWEVYQDVGATQPINVVSAYRAPATNEMLRNSSSGVAKNSRHTKGMAMDFFIPGIPLNKLREAAFKLQVGGVGYYPTSGSPFVHLDTGNVRAWPRMTRSQLKTLFPDGKTLHVPSDGKVLSQEGYAYAQAQWQKCHSVPCSNGVIPSTRVASASTGGTSGGGKGILTWLFNGDEEGEGGEEGNVQIASASSAPATPVAPAAAPTPVAFPSELRTADATPDVPFGTGSDPLVVASIAPEPAPRPSWLGDTAAEAVSQIAALSAPIPEPRSAMAERSETQAPAVTAYAAAAAEAGAKISSNLRLASSSQNTELSTFAAVLAQRRQAVGIEERKVELIAPDLDHIVEVFVDDNAMSSTRYAVILEQVEGDFDPATELGMQTARMGFTNDPSHGLSTHSFQRTKPLLMAAR